MTSILLIEDEVPIADMLRGFFERDGIEFLHAESGEDGLNRLKHRPVDAVLLDLNLPGMDGVDVCRNQVADVRKLSSGIGVAVDCDQFRDLARGQGFCLGRTDLLLPEPVPHSTTVGVADDVFAVFSTVSAGSGQYGKNRDDR